MSCDDLIKKKEFGIRVYQKLKEKYGQKKHYEVVEIKEIVSLLNYPKSHECWALVAFMMPANVGEYFRAQGTPMKVLEMKKEFILAMTDGSKTSLNLPNAPKTMYDIEIPELTKANLIDVIALYEGRSLGYDLVTDVLGGV